MNPISYQGVAYADFALHYEVHLRHIIILVIDEHVLLGGVEAARHEPEADVVEVTAFLVLSRVKKVREMPKNVFE